MFKWLISTPPRGKGCLVRGLLSLRLPPGSEAARRGRRRSLLSPSTIFISLTRVSPCSCEARRRRKVDMCLEQAFFWKSLRSQNFPTVFNSSKTGLVTKSVLQTYLPRERDLGLVLMKGGKKQTNKETTIGEQKRLSTLGSYTT